MPEIRPGACLLDASVLVDPSISSALPSETWISTRSFAQHAAGPHATDDSHGLESLLIEVVDASPT